MPTPDPNITAHLEWLGFVRPTGLVLSAPALVNAGAILDRRDAEGQRHLRACVEERQVDGQAGAEPCLPDFRAFAQAVLGWSFSPKGYAGTEEAPLPKELEAALSDTGEVVRPDFVVYSGAAPPQAPPSAAHAVGRRTLSDSEGLSKAQAASSAPHAVGEARAEYAASETASPWQLLVSVLPLGEDFDSSARGRMERLLRQTGSPAGLLFNGVCLRLISAPRGESSGWLDFRVQDMVQTAGRPICAAMRLLLRETRLLSVPRRQRLAGLLENSRKFQNEVSERLAEQVLHAGEQAALAEGFAHAAQGQQGQGEAGRRAQGVQARLQRSLAAGERLHPP